MTGNGHEVDVLVVGAGPVGLTLANILGLQDIHTLVAEERASLIDYPRGVGLDDEALRTFQSIGLVDEILPHTVPNQILRFFDAKRRVLAEIAPPDARFGWPKRNGFVQPLVDAELLRGLDRFDHVEVWWNRPVMSCAETGDAVTVECGGEGGVSRVRADYVIGCDGGRSVIRRTMGVSFEGTTSPTRWLVVDIANDPLGHPNSEVGADPERPYASISIAHGIRRFEFMIHADESDEQAEDPAFLTRMLARVVPYPDRVEVIRRRVYTHHSRIAGAFRSGRLLLAGDAAHLMPVWQGQGYNSGIRDAANLGWKLAAVVTGQARDSLLDTYDMERRKHARAMIDLSTMVGKVISPTDRRVAAGRDLIVRAASIVPALKRYVLEMRFKPMPSYERGAVVHLGPRNPRSPVGTLFVQPGSTPAPAATSCWTTCWAPGSPCCAGTTTRGRSLASPHLRRGRRWVPGSLPLVRRCSCAGPDTTIPMSWSSVTTPETSSPGSTLTASRWCSCVPTGVSPAHVSPNSLPS
ncbi:3-(3-hydroxy-phenyl)propionate/3-hydroxycinnamic acid hydroxylase [Mycobacterium kansasii 824]|uniref:3-(3-hydroxy-phenyl)propionate/3-hydroxycinnamic acid hydroxylase n=1 Tax=Mycobacterium kansasii TaxID=1768 RepID=A0A1V3X6Z8_MYCKA|nr:3-(3-hydroxy-phenyl)propionate/3-hydroxycinnamic acid hydroxylase [Mycobacterium kansasii 824]OOK75003.1 3-(3-hydroxy-phenyl)propionate/3-hydroxycinnamic acid hydroxylase [Mycobacterium kansasii]